MARSVRAGENELDIAGNRPFLTCTCHRGLSKVSIVRQVLEKQVSSSVRADAYLVLVQEHFINIPRLRINLRAGMIPD